MVVFVQHTLKGLIYRGLESVIFSHLNKRLMTSNIKEHANGYSQYYCLHQIMIQIQQNLENDTESRTLPLWLIDQEKLDD